MGGDNLSKSTKLKFVGLVLGFVGWVVSLVCGAVADQQVEAIIDEKIDERMKELETE